MKKMLIRTLGLAAFAALMVYNVSLFESSNKGDTSLFNLGRIAEAQSDGGGGSTGGGSGGTGCGHGFNVECGRFTDPGTGIVRIFYKP